MKLKGMMLAALLTLASATAGAVVLPVDGVTGATQQVSQAAREKAQARTLLKAMDRCRKQMPMVHGAMVEMAVCRQGKLLSCTKGWQQKVVPAVGAMKKEKEMNFRTTLQGKKDVLTYQYYTAVSSGMCMVRLAELDACVYMSACPDVAQSVASTIHQYLAPAMEKLFTQDDDADI